MDPIIRICKILPATALLVFAAPTNAAQEASDLYWSAQRQELAGQGNEALKTYAKLLARNPESGSVANNLLMAAIREGSFPDALFAIKAAQRVQQADADASIFLFADAFRRRKWRDADVAIAALEKDGDFAFVAPMLRGWANVAKGQPSGFTIDSLRGSGLASYYGDDQLIYFDMVDGNMAQAKLRLRGFRGYGEPHGRFLASHAMGEFTRSGDVEFASALGQQIGLDPGNYATPPISAEIGLSMLLARLSLALDEQRQAQKGLAFARLATWVAPNSDAAKLALAELLDRQDMEAKAVSVLKTVATFSPFWVQAVINQTQIAATAAEAASVAQAASDAQPASSQLKLVLAQTLERAGKRDEAIAVYKSLLAGEKHAGNAGRRAALLLLLAMALDSNGDWNGAYAALEEALVLDTRNAQILNYLGYSLLERRIDVARGFDLVSQAHHLAPQSAAITDSLGWAYFLKGDVFNAIPLLEQAVMGAIADPAINEHLGDAYWAAGRHAEARFAWKAAVLSAEGHVERRIAQKIDFGWTKDTAAP